MALQIDRVTDRDNAVAFHELDSSAIGAFPDAESVQTYNASENEHMIAVNEELGFRAVERSTRWQLKL